jgi:hypothetical protein
MSEDLQSQPFRLKPIFEKSAALYDHLRTVTRLSFIAAQSDPASDENPYGFRIGARRRNSMISLYLNLVSLSTFISKKAQTFFGGLSLRGAC